ncbi:MAG: YceI family protein [Gammaproteobacteria bacterium]
MTVNKAFKYIVLTVSLLTGAGLVLAEEDELCAAFRDGMVNESLLATMLSAAHDGHLYRIQQTSSQVGFCVDSKLSRVKGNFTDFLGGISLNPGDNDDGQTMVLIKAGSLDTGGSIIENMLKSEKFFDVEHHPEVLFVSDGFEWTGPDTAVLKGNLTMRGITKPVIFDVTLKALDAERVDQAQKIVVNATTMINRADFGMDGLSALVSSDVHLCMSVEALKYQS